MILNNSNNAPPAADRKAAILGAALSAFSSKGIDATTIDDIRQYSQASVGSIYHHFRTKEGIAAALFAQGLDDYWGQLLYSVKMARTGEQAIHSLVEAHILWITSKPDMARFLFSRRQAISLEYEQATRERSVAYLKATFELLKPWFSQGILRRLPADLYAPLLLGPAQELARLWLSGRSSLNPNSAIKELAEAAWRSIATDPSQPGTPI
jgi:AcrR family transcriptional regulator